MSRAVMQQALEALVQWEDEAPHAWSKADENAVAALRAALAEPEQEPVAWAFRYDDGSWHDPSLTKHSRGMLPLYSCTTPPQRKPLTEDEIADLWDGHTVPVFGKTGINPIVFARAIERAHGITGGSK